MALQSVHPTSETTPPTTLPRSNPTTASSPPDPEKTGLGAGLYNFGGPWIEQEKNVHRPIESNNDKNNNNKMKSSSNSIEDNYNRKLNKILKNPNFTVATTAELIRELNRKRKLAEDLQKQRNTIPPANSVFLSTGGGNNPSTRDNNSHPYQSNPTAEGKVYLSKKDNRGMREDSDFTTDSGDETETESEESQQQQQQKQQPQPQPKTQPQPQPQKQLDDPPSTNKTDKTDKTVKAGDSWMKSIQEIKKICQSHKLICPYKKLLQAHRILNTLISTKTGRTASPFRLMKGNSLIYTEKKRTTIQFDLIKLLASLCFRADTLFKFLNAYQPPVHPYTQPERFFIKTLVQMSSYPIHTIPSRKVRQVCQE